MKIYRLIAAAALLAAIAVLPAYAQGSGAAPAGSAATNKIAFVDTRAFGGDDKGNGGITRYVNAMRTLEKEFQPRETELQNIQSRINTLAEDIRKLSGGGGVVDPKTIRQKQDEGEKLARELDFKKKDAEAAFQKRYADTVGPIYDDIAKSLDAFAKQRGISMLFDVSKLARDGTILAVDSSLDLTKTFIAEYNTRNPATASR